MAGNGNGVQRVGYVSTSPYECRAGMTDVTPFEIIAYDSPAPRLARSAMTVTTMPTDHATTNERMVRFVCEHGAVPYCVLDRLFYNGKSCGNAVSKLSKPDPTDRNRPALLKPHRQALPK